MKIGYKGLTADLKAIQGGYSSNKEIYEIGKIYSKENIENPRLCSNEGYHYCNDLEDVFNHYKRDGKNRFFKIEVLGNFTDDREYESKSITTSFKLLEELSEDFFKEWDSHADERKEVRELRKIEKNLKLDAVKIIQTKYPTFHVGGSIGLFLHGIRLKRWINNKSSDIDMIAPYFILPEFNSDEDDEDDEVDSEYKDAKKSGNDFDETFVLYGDFGSVKIDYRIDPHQRYEIIEYKGFKYKVSPLMTIMDAKMKYAMNGQRKHAQDIKEMILPTRHKNK
jgi:hypothetical protein